MTLKEKANAARRIADFQSRISPGQEPHQLRSSAYLPVNPFSDEAEVLEAIGASPNVCTKVDAYWRVNGDVIFVQVSSKASFSPRPVGWYRRWSSGSIFPVNLVSVVSESEISRAVFERELLGWMDGGVATRALEMRAKMGAALEPVWKPSTGTAGKRSRGSRGSAG